MVGRQVFRLNNFFTAEEADKLIEGALAISEPANKLKRSTTGQGDGEENVTWRKWYECEADPASGNASRVAVPAAAQQDSHRTSENAWDLSSPTAMRLKKRCFELLGIRPYMDGWADGLQILRYNLTQAYNSHHDYLEYTPGSRLDSHSGGANR